MESLGDWVSCAETEEHRVTESTGAEEVQAPGGDCDPATRGGGAFPVGLHPVCEEPNPLAEEDPKLPNCRQRGQRLRYRQLQRQHGFREHLAVHIATDRQPQGTSLMAWCRAMATVQAACPTTATKQQY